MLVGVPRETKVREDRVGLVPTSVRELVAHGNRVIVERDAGVAIGIPDEEYESAGATVVRTAEVWERAELIVKVKEPQAAERKQLRDGQILFAYLHLAPDPAQTKDLVESGATCVAYETITSHSGGLPLLAPMSEVAGRMSIQVGAHFLERTHGGRGVLLGGVPGVSPATVAVLGGGVVGTHAIQVALGMGANVCVLDRSLEQLRLLSRYFGRPLETEVATRDSVEKRVLASDLVIGGVLVPGATAPKLVSAETIRGMRPGSVVIDVAIDQGGCFETSRPSTHDEPVYTVDDVTHYCVTNMPGGVPRTSTFALNNATLPFVLALAGGGMRRLLEDPCLLAGLNVHSGHVTHRAVAEAQDRPYVEPRKALQGAAL